MDGVYLVTRGWYGEHDGEVIGVFTSRSKAEAYIAEAVEAGWSAIGFNEIVRLHLDPQFKDRQ